jgi:hypothetical protein
MSLVVDFVPDNEVKGSVCDSFSDLVVTGRLFSANSIFVRQQYSLITVFIDHGLMS